MTKNILLICGSILAASALNAAVVFATSNTLSLKAGDSAVITCAAGTTPTPTPSPVPTPTPQPTGSEVRFTAYTTGYSFWDNTPPRSADISNPVIHAKAGGTGTFDNPITIAVGHTISGNKDTLDYPAGTIFYIPNMRRYFIVEDACGDGKTPQNGPCHTGYQGHPWIDLYVGGQAAGNSKSNTCMDQITDLHLVIKNPAPNYVVVSGEIASSCGQFGDTIVTK